MKTNTTKEPEVDHYFLDHPSLGGKVYKTIYDIISEDASPFYVGEVLEVGRMKELPTIFIVPYIDMDVGELYAYAKFASLDEAEEFKKSKYAEYLAREEREQVEAGREIDEIRDTPRFI